MCGRRGETNQEVGDRANDAIRVTAAEVRAKVIGEGANLGVTQRGAHRVRPAWRRLQFRRHRQFGRRQLLRRRGQHQDRAGLGHAQGRADAAGAQQAARRDDRRGRARSCSPTTTSRRWRSRCARKARHGRLAAPGALHGGAGSARPARPRGRDPAIAGGARRARGARRAADPRRTRRAARLCQDRAVLRHRRQRRARRSAFRARPARPISPTAWTRNSPPTSRPPAAPRDHRARRRQRPHQPRRAVLRHAGCRMRPGTARATWCAPSRWCATASACRRSTREIDALDNRIDGQVQLDLYATVGRLVLAASAWDLKNGSGSEPLGTADRGAPAGPQDAGAEARDLLPDVPEGAPGCAQARAGRGRHAAKSSQTGSRCSTPAADPRHRAGRARRTGADLVAAAKAFFAVTEAFRIGRIEDAAGVDRARRLLRQAGAGARRRHDRRGAARHHRRGAVGLRQAAAIRSRPGWRPAANASPRRANGCRR